MLKIVQFFLVIIFLLALNNFKGLAQGVSISSTGALPDPSAVLDVSADSSGVLLPRVSLNDTADQSTIASPTTSLIVYNSNASMTGGNGVGLYQWSGSKWVNLVAPTNGPGADGQVLTSKGAGNSPVWKTGSSGSDCSVSKRTFITSGLFNGNLGGIAGADSICQAYADTQSLGGSWKAFLSGDNTSEWAINRLSFDWDVLRDLWGRPITTGDRVWGGHHFDGSINQVIYQSNAIMINEKGNMITTVKQAWLTPQGGGDPGPNDCSNWTSGVAGNNGTRVQSGALSRRYFADGSTWCSMNYRLVCVEQ